MAANGGKRQAFYRGLAIVVGEADCGELRSSEGTSAMAQLDATVDMVWTAFRALPPEARDRFVEKMVADVALREELEDLLDTQMANERLDEPVRPLDDVLDELGKS